IPSSAATTSDSTPMVLYCRARYASAPSWMALEIFCISAVPRPRERTQRARNTAKIRASALAPMTTVRSDDCVCVMMRGKWECGGAGRSGRGGDWALDAAPEVEHGDPDQHQHEAGDGFGPRGGGQEEEHHHAAAQQDVQRRQQWIPERAVGSHDVGPLRAEDEQPGRGEDVEQERCEDDVVEELVVR